MNQEVLVNQWLFLSFSEFSLVSFPFLWGIYKHCLLHNLFLVRIFRIEFTNGHWNWESEIVVGSCIIWRTSICLGYNLKLFPDNSPVPVLILELNCCLATLIFVTTLHFAKLLSLCKPLMGQTRGILKLIGCRYCIICELMGQQFQCVHL